MGRPLALSLVASLLAWTAAVSAGQHVAPTTAKPSAAQPQQPSGPAPQQPSGAPTPSPGGAPTQKPSAAPTDEPPGPRVAIGGVRTIDCASTVVYAGAPLAPHHLHATYAFPDRARWWLGVGAESAPERQMRFRFGGALSAIDLGSATSRRLDGAERNETLIQLEMRRALILWPSGMEWAREATMATARVGLLGTLTARFQDAQAKRPTSIVFTGADGRPGDEYRAIEWREDKDKAWPTKLELWHEKLFVWSETIDTIDKETRFIDSFFLPPDQREASAGNPLEVGAVRAIDLPEFRARRFPLAAGATWDTARAEWARLTAEQGALLKPAGFTLDDKASFEVSESLMPTAVLLRLGAAKGARDPAIEATFALSNERPGISTFVIGLAALKPELLTRVRKSVPVDARAGVPYVRFDPSRPEQHVLLVLPLAVKDG